MTRLHQRAVSMGSGSLTSQCTDNSQIVSCEFYVYCVLLETSMHPPHSGAIDLSNF